MLVIKEEDMAREKLSAIITRSKFASRDFFDLWFFLKNNWGINEAIVRQKTGMSLNTALEKVQSKAAALKNTELLMGFGDLLDNKQKTWVREKLKEELLFQLKLFKETHT